MIKFLKTLFSTILLVVALAVASEAAFEVPSLRGPVNDNARMLSRATSAQVRQSLIQLKSQGGSQIVLLTVPSLQGEAIEQASIAVTDKWKIGDADKDNGVLLLIAKKERRIRIEVGQGLEGSLTDAHSKRIIEEVMVPLFRSGNASQGILLGLYNIALKANPDIDVKAVFGGEKWQAPVKTKKSGLRFIPILLFVLLMLMPGNRGSGFRAIMLGMLLGGMTGGRGGYRSSGGGFGGGGFGGGGGFSGGGASGGW